MSEDIAAAYADSLVSAATAGVPVRGTWFNHYSVQRARKAGVNVDEFTHIGVDGIFLRKIAQIPMQRTSADLVVPPLLNRLGEGARVGLIGSTRENVLEAAQAMQKIARHELDFVFARSGFDPLLDAAGLAREAGDLDLLLLGLGAPLQDSYLLEIKDANAKIVLTCGGFFDQVTQEEYYPAWAYRLRLNWLVRLAREPRRLYRRYTVDALHAIWDRAAIRRYLRSGKLHEPPAPRI